MSFDDIDLGQYHVGSNGDFDSQNGLTEDAVRERSWLKGEPDWMLEMRLDSLENVAERATSAPSRALPSIDFDYLERTDGRSDEWDVRPDAVPETNPSRGSSESERPHPGGHASQNDADAVFDRNREDLERQGVVFTDLDTALRTHPEIVELHLGKIITPDDNRFASLNSAAWSGGSFIYVPPGVEVEMPLQASHRARAENPRVFERTLVIADEGSRLHYIEGCSAPLYSREPLHSAVVEIVVKPSAHVSYTTIQNWSSNVLNVVTKGAYVEAEGYMEWIDGNIGSHLTLSCPAIWLAGPKARGQVFSVAYAGRHQRQETGSAVIHAAPETMSKVVSKSISNNGGHTLDRGLVRVADEAYGCESRVSCKALVLDDESGSDTVPEIEVGSDDARIDRDVTVSNVAAEQLFYLMSRGLAEQQAIGMIVNGFIEPVTRTLPMEYAVEWSRLIELEIEGSIG